MLSKVISSAALPCGLPKARPKRGSQPVPSSCARRTTADPHACARGRQRLAEEQQLAQLRQRIGDVRQRAADRGVAAQALAGDERAQPGVQRARRSAALGIGLATIGLHLRGVVRHRPETLQRAVGEAAQSPHLALARNAEVVAAGVGAHRVGRALVLDVHRRSARGEQGRVLPLRPVEQRVGVDARRHRGDAFGRALGRQLLHERARLSCLVRRFGRPAAATGGEQREQHDGSARHHASSPHRTHQPLIATTRPPYSVT